jgi:5-methylcytosine-specific restriction endonuclease McrA
MKSKRSKACDISQAVKERVWERDSHRCIFCGSPQAMPNAHFIPRSKGGLGIEQNIVTACIYCHQLMDQGTFSQRHEKQKRAKEYLDNKYLEFDHNKRFYKK